MQLKLFNLTQSYDISDIISSNYVRLQWPSTEQLRNLLGVTQTI